MSSTQHSAIDPPPAVAPPPTPVTDAIMAEFSGRVSRIEADLAELKAELSALADELGAPAPGAA